MLKVLVVEDEEMIRKGIVLAVDWAALDCVVVGEAADGLQALKAVERYDPSLIITDLKMPNMDGIQMMEALRARGSRAYVIILTAYDSFTYARSALRLGAAKVIVLYRRTAEAMPAYRQEVEEALHEGVEIMELVKPVRFISDKHGSVAKVECIRCETGQFDNRGRREIKDIPNSNFFVDIDVVIPAVSQYADLPFIPRGEIGVTKWGTFIIDEDTYMTTEEGVFAGGDVARGPDEVIRAISDGKNAAISIDLYLGGEGKLNKGQEIDIPLLEDDDEIISHERFEKEILPLEERHSFEEVIRGYHKLNAIAEAMRCLHCNRR